jgi:hypothetical protein
MNEALKERLLSKCVLVPGPLETPCLEFMGARADGYGRLRVDGENRLAHRISYELFVGKIPDGLLCLHRCDVRPCVEPSHLFLGSAQDNSNDMVMKGRHVTPIGEMHGRVILTEREASEIKFLVLEGHLSQHEIAEMYSVSRGAVTNIKQGRTWSWVKSTEPLPSPPPILTEPLVRRI